MSEPGTNSTTSAAVDVKATHVAAFLKHSSPILACRFSPAADSVFFAAEDYQVWRWRWQQEGPATPFVGHNSWVRAIGFSPDGKTLVTGGYDGQLIWWDAQADEPRPLRELAAHQGWIRALAVSPDGSWVTTVGNDLAVRVWRMDDGSLARELAGHESHIYNVVFHPHEPAMVTGDLKANLFHWDFTSDEPVRKLKVESFYKYDKGFRADIGGFRGLVFNADGTRLAGAGMINVTNAFAGVGNPAVVEIDWASGEQTIQHESKSKLRGVAWGVALHPQPLAIGVNGGAAGGYLLFWRPGEKEEHHSFKLPNTGRDLDMASDCLHLVTAHYDRHVRICRMTAQA